MKRVRIVTILNNYGEEKFIVQFTTRIPYFLFWTKEVWADVTFANSDDPFFYDSYDDALVKGRDILANANPNKQYIVTQTNVEEITV